MAMADSDISATSTYVTRNIAIFQRLLSKVLHFVANSLNEVAVGGTA
jgi:hypothetical protein